MLFERCAVPRRMCYLVIVFSLLLRVVGATECSTTVVSVLPSFTETAYALGFGECIIGVSDFCRFPEAARSKPRVGGLLNPNLERIVTLKPRVVVLSVAHKDLEAKLTKLGFATRAFATDDLNDVYAMTEACGLLFGKPEVAQQALLEWRACLQTLAQETSGLPRPRTLLVVSRQPGELRDIYVATPRSYHGELLSYAGAENVAQRKTALYAVVTKEEIIGWNPEVILDLSPGEALDGSAALAGEKEVWYRLATVDAVRQKRVFVKGDAHLTIPGPAMCETAHTLATLVHSSNSRAPSEAPQFAPPRSTPK